MHEENPSPSITQVLIDARKLSVTGAAEEFAQAFEKFRRLGINMVIGFPLSGQEDWVVTFSRYLCRFQRH